MPYWKEKQTNKQTNKQTKKKKEKEKEMATEIYILKASKVYFLAFHCQSSPIQINVKADLYR